MLTPKDKRQYKKWEFDKIQKEREQFKQMKQK